MRGYVLDALNDLIQRMVKNPEEIMDVTLAGNTAMHHIILGLPVKQLGAAPYRPAVCHAMDVKARDFGLHIAGGAYVHCMPNIAGFVGADHVAMLLATGIYESGKTVIGIDIGTNTEVTLAYRKKMICASCASGPAFEGAGISHGMRAAMGAIESVKIDGDGVRIQVIGNAKPKGICGSGILDVLSELLRNRILDARGFLKNHRLVREGLHGPEFILASGDKTMTGRDIVVTQQDIEKIRLAKAAIKSGINILLGEAGITEKDVGELIIAGAFGQFMNPTSAVNIGMLPSLPPDSFRQVGNAAGVGVKLVLISKEKRDTAAEIPGRVQYVELTTHPKFTREFSHALRFF